MICFEWIQVNSNVEKLRWSFLPLLLSFVRQNCVEMCCLSICTRQIKSIHPQNLQKIQNELVACLPGSSFSFSFFSLSLSLSSFVFFSQRFVCKNMKANIMLKLVTQAHVWRLNKFYINQQCHFNACTLFISDAMTIAWAEPSQAKHRLLFWVHVQ